MTKEIMPKDELASQINVLFPPTTDESYLLVGCQRIDYSASRISRAVEDCDARVLNLNVTSIDTAPTHVVVALRIDHRNPNRVVNSLERYGFDVISASSSDPHVNESMRARADEILKILEI